MSVDHSWHVEVDRLQGYASGATLPVERGSIEAHLLACEQCRSNLATVRPAPANDAVLQAITDRIDQPRRILRRSTGALRASSSRTPTNAPPNTNPAHGKIVNVVKPGRGRR